MASDSAPPLSAAGVDFSNETQASDFLGQLLDDSIFQIDGNAMGRRFWYGVVVVIGVAAVSHFAWRLSLLRRTRSSYTNHPHPAQSRSSLMDKTFILARRLWYPQVTPKMSAFWIRVPPFGTIYMILAYFVFIIVLGFIDVEASAVQYWTLLGIRAGWLAAAQIPLIVLLAGKNSLISLLTGVSYERLNVFHRWIARGLLLLATFHFAFLSTSWDRYGLTRLEWATDTAPPTGIAAYAILLWINLSTIAPLRHLSYEFFVVQHILTFFGFIIALAMHIPGSAKYARVWVYIASALYLAERLVYAIRFAWTNIRPGRTTLEALDGRVTRLRVSSRQIKNWAPGTHVLLMIPRFGLVQSHPATIMSTPTSHGGDMVFLLRAYRGMTKRAFQAAPAVSSSPAFSTTSIESVSEKHGGLDALSYLTLVNGPYGSSHADFACFDSVLLIAGATGVTFTMAVLLDLAERAASPTAASLDNGRRVLPVRVIHFIWMIKKRSWLAWIINDLQSVVADLARAGIELFIEVYVTQNDTAESPERGSRTYDEPPADAASTSNAARIEDPGRIADKNVAKVPASQDSSIILRSGRPMLDAVFENILSKTEGECAVGACGPLGLSTDVRRQAVAFNGKDGNHGVYLHVENFS